MRDVGSWLIVERRKVPRKDEAAWVVVGNLQVVEELDDALVGGLQQVGDDANERALREARVAAHAPQGTADDDARGGGLVRMQVGRWRELGKDARDRRVVLKPTQTSK